MVNEGRLATRDGGWKIVCRAPPSALGASLPTCLCSSPAFPAHSRSPALCSHQTGFPQCPLGFLSHKALQLSSPQLTLFLCLLVTTSGIAWHQVVVVSGLHGNRWAHEVQTGNLVCGQGHNLLEGVQGLSFCIAFTFGILR